MNTATNVNTTTETRPVPARLIRLPEVMNRVTLSRPTIYRLMTAGNFPRIVKVGAASFWVESEIEAWIQDRIADPRDVGV